MAEDPLYLVYLAGVDYAANGFQTATLRAVRHIREVLGSDHSLRPAREAVDRFLATPTVKLLIDATNDREAAERAVQEAVDYHQGAAVFEINPTDLALPDPEVDPEAEEVTAGDEPAVPSIGAYKTALALMGMESGDPTRAYYRAAMLGSVTDHGDFYDEVKQALMSVFPPMAPSVTVIK